MKNGGRKSRWTVPLMFAWFECGTSVQFFTKLLLNDIMYEKSVQLTVVNYLVDF